MRALFVGLVLLLAGCMTNATEGDPAVAPTTTAAAPTGDGAALFNTTEAAPTFMAYNESFDFLVTYASTVAGGGTNFGQTNCVSYEPVTMANATATATWTPSLPGEEQLELVISDFQGTFDTLRQSGTSPLVLEYDFPKGVNQVAISVQSVQTGAVQQLPVQLTITFEHWAEETPEPRTIICAF